MENCGVGPLLEAPKGMEEGKNVVVVVVVKGASAEGSTRVGGGRRPERGEEEEEEDKQKNMPPIPNAACSISRVNTTSCNSSGSAANCDGEAREEKKTDDEEEEGWGRGSKGAAPGTAGRDCNAARAGEGVDGVWTPPAAPLLPPA